MNKKNALKVLLPHKLCLGQFAKFRCAVNVCTVSLMSCHTAGLVLIHVIYTLADTCIHSHILHPHIVPPMSIFLYVYVSGRISLNLDRNSETMHVQNCLFVCLCLACMCKGKHSVSEDFCFNCTQGFFINESDGDNKNPNRS